MVDIILFFIHYALILLFGVVLSFTFCSISFASGKNFLSVGILFTVCGILQLAAYLYLGEEVVWEIYPLITHLPVILFLFLRYRKRIITILSAVTTAYLCCQPAKWIGLMVMALTHSDTTELIFRILTLIVVGFIARKYIAPYISKLFEKDFVSICIFGSIPIFYYLFDYVTAVYTYLWHENSQLTIEFLPFALCVFFMVFCVVYYKEYERKADAERRAQLIRISAQQQAAQIEAVKRTEQELRIIRHDMRLLLNTVAMYIENGDHDSVKEIIASYTSRIEGTKLNHFCCNDMVNYVLSDFAEKCKNSGIPFQCNVEIDQLDTDEMLFSSILSTALDNALNAQKVLPDSRKNIKVMLKNMDGKLLLSVKNTILKAPVFADGLPVATRKGHGYGTQSIRYVTEQLGGNWQFSVQDGWFILRIVL